MNHNNFMKKLAWIIHLDDRCWEWKSKKKHPANAYRYSFEFFHHPITKDKPCVCHTCDNGRCVNPNHLWDGTHQDNMKDRDIKGRQAKGDRQGARLHPEKFQHGSKHHLAKLNQTQAEEINFLLKNTDMSKSEIARRFKIGRDAIKRIDKGKHWSQRGNNETTNNNRSQEPVCSRTQDPNIEVR